MTVPPSTQSGVFITTQRFPLAWLFWTFKTDVSIDEETVVVPWGTHFFNLAPGRHRIRIGFHYLWAKDMGADEIECEIERGATITLTYRSPFLVTSKGSIVIG